MMNQIHSSIAMSTIIRHLATEAHMDSNFAQAQRYHAMLDHADDTMLAAIWMRLHEKESAHDLTR